jgi:hypothetical protein
VLGHPDIAAMCAGTTYMFLRVSLLFEVAPAAITKIRLPCESGQLIPAAHCTEEHCPYKRLRVADAGLGSQLGSSSGPTAGAGCKTGNIKAFPDVQAKTPT